LFGGGFWLVVISYGAILALSIRGQNKAQKANTKEAIFLNFKPLARTL
jgi:hypothetical protein